MPLLSASARARCLLAVLVLYTGAGAEARHDRHTLLARNSDDPTAPRYDGDAVPHPPVTMLDVLPVPAAVSTAGTATTTETRTTENTAPATSKTTGPAAQSTDTGKASAETNAGGATPSTTPAGETTTTPDASTADTASAEAAALPVVEPTPQPAPAGEQASPARPATETANSPDAASSTNGTAGTRQVGRLTAASVRWENGVAIAQGTPENPVRLETVNGFITAQELRVNLDARTVVAHGNVLVEYTRVIPRETMTRSSLSRERRLTLRRQQSDTQTERLHGENLELNFNTRRGKLDDVRLEVSDFDIAATAIEINGRVYMAHNVVIRPGGLTEAERAIYGTPPFNLRAKTLTVDATDETRPPRIAVKNAGLYYKNRRILPVPSYLFSAINRRNGRERKTFSLIPQVSVNSADGVLLTSRLSFPLSGSGALPDVSSNDRAAPGTINSSISVRGTGRGSLKPAFAINADLGLSARVGARGGLSLDGSAVWGGVSLRARRSDIVTTQLTNRIELDRLPEFVYASPLVPVVVTKSGYGLGIFGELSTGKFTERLINSPQSGLPRTTVRSSRHQVLLGLTTRVTNYDGLYADVVGSVSRYGLTRNDYRYLSMEVGYQGNIGDRVRGIFSYRTTSLNGATPFRFDTVEIAREIRTTFDVQITPRYLIPLDFRYDVDAGRFRDKSFGILRSYKNFAYGIAYNTARQDLHMEFRSGF